MSGNIVVLSTEDSFYFGHELAYRLGTDVTPTERRVFPGGERYFRIVIPHRDELAGKIVVVVGSTHADSCIDEIERVGTACAMYGARRVFFVIPFAGYSTMERATLPGEIVPFKIIARRLSAIPFSGSPNVFLMMDLHVSGSVHYFEGNCLRFELLAEDHFIELIEKMCLINPVFASADLGRMRVIEKLAKYFGAGMAFISKEREFEHTRVLAVIGDVADRDVVIYDDMTRSSGTIVHAVEAYLRANARSVRVFLSHAAFNNEAAMRMLVDSQAVQIVVTNSHPSSQMPEFKLSPKVQFVDMTGDFACLIGKLI